MIIPSHGSSINNIMGLYINKNNYVSWSSVSFNNNDVMT